MPTRSWTASGENYRYGFQGQEQDDEIYGNNNATAAEFWEYNPRLGRRWNLDIKSPKFLSPYVSLQNNPIAFLDIPGDTVFYFNSDGYFLRMDPEITIFGANDGIIVFNASNYSNAPKGASSYYTFNDQNKDVLRMSYMINLEEKAKINSPLLYFYSNEDIQKAMKHGGTDHKMNSFHRYYYISTESNGGKMDFWATYLEPPIGDIFGPGFSDPDKDKGPFYVFNNNQNKAYNIMDAGNWLWGLGAHNIGCSYFEVQQGSKSFARRDSHKPDPKEDQDAIRKGYTYDPSQISEPIYPAEQRKSETNGN